MTKKIIFSQIILLLALAVFSGCKKSGDKMLGPEYGAAPNVGVLNNKFDAYNKVITSGVEIGPVTSVNINTNYQFYKTTFSEKVGWKLTISSWKTKAVKVFSGYSDFIDATNTLWDGGSDNEYFFGYTSTNDSVEVKLTFVGSDLTIIDTIRLTNVKGYHNKTFNGVFHYLVDDFDGSNLTGAFSPFYPDLQDINGGNGGNNAYNGIKCQGDFSYHMYGYDANNNTYIGSCNTPTLNDIPLNTFTATDPHNLFVNMYIYGTGKPNTTVSIITFENDSEYAPGDVFDQNTNDKYICQVSVDWKGWKLVSIRYSSFRKPNLGGGLGNNRLNPERVSGLALELDSYPTYGYGVEAMVDMVVLTQDGVFQK